MSWRFSRVLLWAFLASGCAARRLPPLRTVEIGYAEEGYAVWYGAEAQGGPTASGERFDMNALTAAHRRLPFGTFVRVESLRNGRSVVVRINDRGPYGRPARIIDVSRAAARALGMIDAGVVPARIVVVGSVTAP